MGFVKKNVIIFTSQLFYRCIPKCLYPLLLKGWFRIHRGYKLNLKQPERFTEKIQWLKLYDTTPLKTRLSDKYSVRSWVAERIGEEYLIPLLGVWDRFEDIDFDKLPDQFVLKANHGCAMNIIVRDKSKFNQREAQKKFKTWMKMNFAYRSGFEMQYKDTPLYNF